MAGVSTLNCCHVSNQFCLLRQVWLWYNKNSWIVDEIYRHCTCEASDFNRRRTIAKPKSTNLGKNWFLLATAANFGANIRLTICLLLPWKSLNQTAIVWWTLAENYLLVKTRGNCDQETRKQLERESRDIFSASLSITSLVENWYLPSGKEFQGNNKPHLHLTEIINKHCGISSISKMDGTLKWKIQTKHLMPLFGWPRMYAIGAVILDHLGGHSHLRQEIFSLFRIKEYWGNCTLTLKIEVLECNALGVM